MVEGDAVMAAVVSVINLKGGVGKTTITVALAEFLALEYGKRVLVIDLDPQTNSTVALIGEEEWEARNSENRTLYQLFKDHVDDTCLFDLERSIVRSTSNLQGGLKNLHLLPSSLDFVQIQDRLINIGHSTLIRPVDVLCNAVKNRLDEYDIVLIDCPPNLGIVTQNGLNISDWFLIPTIPDHLSTYGIPQIIANVNNFNRKTGANVRPLGIVISMFRSTVTRHNTTIQRLEAKEAEGLPRLFKTRVPLAAKAAEATDHEAEGIRTLRQKYGSSNSPLFEAFSELSKEFCAYVGL